MQIYILLLKTVEILAPEKHTAEHNYAQPLFQALVSRGIM